MIRNKLLLLAATLLSLKATLGQNPEQPAGTAYSYTIKPVAKLDRTDLEIALHFKVQNDSSLLINLPQDCYGTANYFKYVIAFDGENGCIVQTTANPEERIVTPNKNRDVYIKYVISPDPKELDGVSFGVNSSTSHFHFGGCQWLLPLGNPSQKHRYSITILPVNNWQIYSSLSVDPAQVTVVDSYDNLASSAIGGGRQVYQNRMIHGKPVRVFVSGPYQISTDSIVESIYKIVSLQREWFGDFEHPFYTVSVNQRSGIIAGTCIPNLFVCFIKPEITLDELNGILSHEMFHTWLPNKIDIVRKKGESGLTYEWFEEGFTNYFARLILLEAGLLDEKKFAELVNSDIINLADNPYSTSTYQELIAAGKKGGAGSALKKLSYYRGALIALNWDKQIRNSGCGKMLKDFIIELFHLGIKSNSSIQADDFFLLGKKYSINIKADLERYITNGETINPIADALGNAYELREAEVPSFDPSFSLPETFKTRKIQGVVENGNAWLAGLRNGMDFVQIKNSNRFANGWSHKDPMTVTVKENGEEKKFEFFPRGRGMKLMIYQLKQ